MKKILALLLACFMIVGIFASCTPAEPQGGENETDGGNESTEPKAVTLKVWGPQEDQTSGETEGWLNKMCDKFNEDHPEWDITFEYGVCSEGNAGKNVSQDPEGAADVYFFANDQLGTLLQANAISKLGGAALKQVQDNNSENMVASVSADGSVYGVPFTGNTWFMFYNKSMFSEEDVKSLDAMLAKGKVSFPLTNSWYLASFYVANGGTLFGENGVDAEAGIQFGGDNGAAATKYLVDLVANPNFVDDAGGAGVSGLLDGSIGAVFSGTWDAQKIADGLGENYGACALPTVTIGGEAKQLRSFAGSKAIGVNPNCDNPEVAVALAAFLGSTEAQKAHYEMRGIVPCDKALLADEALLSDLAALAQDATIANTSILQPSIPEMGAYWTPAENMGKAIIAGEVTVDNYAQKTEDFNKSLNESSL